MYFHERSGVAHKNAGQKCRKMSEKGDGENVSKPRSETSIKPSGIKPRSVYLLNYSIEIIKSAPKQNIWLFIQKERGCVYLY